MDLKEAQKFLRNSPTRKILSVAITGILTLLRVGSWVTRIGFGAVFMVIGLGLGGDGIVDLIMATIDSAVYITYIGLTDILMLFNLMSVDFSIFKNNLMFNGDIIEFEKKMDEYIIPKIDLIKGNKEITNDIINTTVSIIHGGIDILGTWLSVFIPNDAGLASVSVQVINLLSRGVSTVSPDFVTNQIDKIYTEIRKLIISIPQQWKDIIKSPEKMKKMIDELLSFLDALETLKIEQMDKFINIFDLIEKSKMLAIDGFYVVITNVLFSLYLLRYLKDTNDD